MKPAWLMTWTQMNDLETLTYDMKALLEVVSDGLLNQECPSNPEDSAGVIRQAVNKLEKIREIHEEMWSEQREAMPGGNTWGLDNGGTDEDADEEENFDTEDLFSGIPLTVDETDIDPEEMSEAVYEAQKRRHESPTSFTVEETKKHEDGSATYIVNGSDEDMKKLFEVFFTQAVINGIKYTAANNEKEIAKMQALKAARELVTWLSVWESGDDIDYEPECAQKRKKLSEALKAAGE